MEIACYFNYRFNCNTQVYVLNRYNIRAVIGVMS